MGRAAAIPTGPLQNEQAHHLLSADSYTVRSAAVSWPWKSPFTRPAAFFFLYSAYIRLRRAYYTGMTLKLEGNGSSDCRRGKQERDEPVKKDMASTRAGVRHYKTSHLAPPDYCFRKHRSAIAGYRNQTAQHRAGSQHSHTSFG
jgi:hypothetical protein